MNSKEPSATAWESDQPIVPLKEGNASGGKGLIAEQALGGKGQPRDEGDNLTETKLKRLTEIVKGNPKAEFTSLAYLLNEDFLKACYHELKKNTATGVDRVTVEEYGKAIDANINSLVALMKRKAYRPKPVRRAYIPKSDGSQRGLGVPAAVDRIVQRAISKILSAVYEGRFLDCAFGFGPNRNAHQALDRINKAIMFKPVHWVVDTDIEQFFDSRPVAI